MTISRLVYAVEIIGTDHRVSITDGGATLDESWSPYAQASVTLPLPNDPAVLDALDPRTGARMRVTMSQRFGQSFTLADLTAGAGSSTASWTASLDGSSLAGWTGEYSTPFNSTGARASRIRSFDLGVRSRSVNYEAGTVDIELASDEARLQDVCLVATSPATPATTTVQGVANLALSSIGAVVAMDAPDVALEADSVSWEPGQSAWDYADTLIKAAGMRLYCDETGDWHLTSPLTPTSGALTFSGANVSALTDDVSRDEEWFDSVVVLWRWRDSSDVEHVRYDTAQTGTPTRTLTLEYDRPYPGVSAAQSILNRSRGRGRVEAVTAVSNPVASPGQALTVNLTDAPIQTGIVTRVIWNFNDDTMQVRSRDLTNTPPTAWVLVPEGYAWQDLPVGMSWAEFDWNTES